MSDKDKLNKLLVVIAGPTASGKTEAAIRIAKKYNTEIVNADSRQVYHELNIGVGKPTQQQLREVPHHLIGHVSILEHYSAGRYTTDALQVIDALFKHHYVVVLCGGTGLYIKSVIEGFDDMPVVPDEVTEYWTRIWKEKGREPLIEKLESLDPAYLEVVDKENPARLIRAVAVSDHCGKPFSSFRTGSKVDRYFNVLPLVLDLPRQELYERINQRVTAMIHRGWMEEAKALYPYRHLKALRTVGYKELFEVIEGNITLEEAIPQIQQSTRRYAKRQLTWWRNQGDWKFVSAEDVEEEVSKEAVVQ